MKLEHARSRLVAAALSAALVALTGVLLGTSSLPIGDAIARGSYDTLHRFAGRNRSLESSPVVVVYLDLESHLQERQDPAQPWPRALHAKLLDRLTVAGAKAVIFDIVFSAAGPDASADAALQKAMRAHGKVLLAAELNASSENTGRVEWTKALNLNLPDEGLSKAAAGWGLANLQVDDDFVVRRFFPGYLQSGQPSLTHAAATLLSLPSSAAADEPRWVRYYGPPFTIPHVSYSSALDGAVPDAFFRGKIVFIGARPIVGLFKERRDELRNPFGSWRDNQLFMPAVEVQATQMLNLVRSDGLSRMTASAEISLLIFTALLFGAGFMWLRPAPATGAALLGTVATAVVSDIAFQRGLWFPWLAIGAVQIPLGLAGSYLFHFGDWYRTRKRLEAERRRAEAKIQEQAALIDKAHDAILVQDLEGKLVYANPSAEKLYRISVAAQQNGGTAKIFQPDKERAQEARAAALAKGDWNGELRQQAFDEKSLIVESRWTLIRDEAGAPEALLIINSDITDKKQLEAQFLRTQRMDTIGSLAGGMAHDLNNALAPVLLGAQLLKRKSPDEEASRILSLMESSTHRGAEMVRQVLLFARGKDGDVQDVNIGALMKELARLARETFPKNIVLETFVAADLLPVRGNTTELHQVLLNLCVNARDAMPDGGRLTLMADNVELSASEIPDLESGSHVSLTVADSGTGMTTEVREKIFEPFFTTKGEGKGTGIGLATVQRIVKKHRGAVRVESEPGKGTSFEILLPRATQTATAQPSPLTAAPSGKGELILVVDDEQAIRDLLGDALRSHGYRVVTAADGAEAIRIFHQNLDEVRLLITDTSMPLMDGRQLILEIRKSRPNVPIIIASASSEKESTPPGVTFIQKPFALEEVLQVIGTLPITVRGTSA